MSEEQRATRETCAWCRDGYDFYERCDCNEYHVKCCPYLDKMQSRADLDYERDTRRAQRRQETT